MLLERKRNAYTIQVKQILSKFVVFLYSYFILLQKLCAMCTVDVELQKYCALALSRRCLHTQRITNWTISSPPRVATQLRFLTDFFFYL